MQERCVNTWYSSHSDRFKYGHDRNSSRLYRDNLLNDSLDELYLSGNLAIFRASRRKLFC